MKPEQYNNALASVRVENKFLKVAIMAIAGVCLLLGVIAFNLIGQEKTIIVPTDAKQSFWVKGNMVSKEYLEEMGYFISSLLLSVSPDTAEYQKTQILKYAAPYARGDLDIKMKVDIRRMKEKGLSTFFFANDMKFLVEDKKVAVTGTLQSFIGDKRVSSRETTWLIAFDYRNGQIYVKDFYETDHLNPFTAKPAVSQ